jgi:hypothetical protein
VPHGEPHGRGVVAGERGQAGGQRGVGHGEHRHLRVLLHRLDAVVADLQIQQQHGVHVACGDPVLDNRVFVVMVHRHAHEQRIVFAFEFGAEAGDQAHHIGFDREQLRVVAQDQADAPRLRLRERLGRAVRLPSQFARDFEHFGARRLGHARLAVERVRDSAAGHP